MAESITEQDRRAGHGEDYLRYLTQERVIDSRLPGWTAPWLIKRYRGKFYYPMPPNDFCLNHESSTQTARLEMTDSGLTVTIPASDAHCIKSVDSANIYDAEVILRVE